MTITFSGQMGVSGIIDFKDNTTIPLYNGALATTPDSQGWLYLTTPVFGELATQTASGGVTTLDTTPEITELAGYFGNVHPSVPTLDRVVGYKVSFGVKVTSETHVSNDRAGFSVIALSEDLLGIEIGFWDDEVWAQSGADFIHAEGQAFDTTTGIIQYELNIEGSSYYLFAAGSQILTGALRDYSSFGAPYTTPSLLFFGDDTTSAEAEIDLETVDLKIGV